MVPKSSNTDSDDVIDDGTSELYHADVPFCNANNEVFEPHRDVPVTSAVLTPTPSPTASHAVVPGTSDTASSVVIDAAVNSPTSTYSVEDTPLVMLLVKSLNEISGVGLMYLKNTNYSKQSSNLKWLFKLNSEISPRILHWHCGIAQMARV